MLWQPPKLRIRKNWRALWQKNEHGKDRQVIKVITGKRVKVSIWSQTEGEFAAKRPADAKICNTSVWSSTQSGQSSSYVPEFHHGTQIHHSLVLGSSQNLLRPHTHRPDQLFALTDPPSFHQYATTASSADGEPLLNLHLPHFFRSTCAGILFALYGVLQGCSLGNLELQLFLHTS